MPEKTISAPTRRSVAKGIAWSAPVIAAASLAPFAAASPTKCINIVPSAVFPTENCDNIAVNPVTQIKISGPNLIITEFLRLELPADIAINPGQTIQIRVSLSGISSGVGIGATVVNAVGLAASVATSQVGTTSEYIAVITLTNSGTTALSGNIDVQLEIKVPLTNLVTTDLNNISLRVQLLDIKWGANESCKISDPFGNLIVIPLNIVNLVLSIADGIIAGGLRICILSTRIVIF